MGIIPICRSKMCRNNKGFQNIMDNVYRSQQQQPYNVYKILRLENLEKTTQRYIIVNFCSLTPLVLRAVSDFLSILAKKIKNLKILLFLNCTVTKISTFLYINLFIVSIGLFVSYLILECLFIFDHTLLHSWAAYNTLVNRNMPKIANTKYVLFSIFFGSILINCS